MRNRLHQYNFVTNRNDEKFSSALVSQEESPATSTNSFQVKGVNHAIVIEEVKSLQISTREVNEDHQ